MATTNEPGLPKVRGRSERLRTLVILCAAGVGTLFFVGDVLGLINGGGVFSVIASYRAVTHEAAFVDVDGAGLRTLFVVALSALISALVAALNIDLDDRVPQLVFVLALVGGAFFADAIWDEAVVTRFMATHGYYRCLTRDHEVGRGKGSVWFHNYAFGSAGCSRGARRG